MIFRFNKFFLFGFGAGSGLLSLYFLILSLISGWNFTEKQFQENWYWILGLSAGFGVQVGLFAYLRNKRHNSVSGKVVAVSGTTSTAAMLICCSHYLVNILPFIGVAGVALFLSQYQTKFFIIGIISNILGIAYLIKSSNVFGKNKTI